MSSETGNPKRRAESLPAGSHLLPYQLTAPQTAHFWKRQTATVIEPGWQGIFATCDKGKEAKAVSEMYPILEEVRRIFGSPVAGC
jgi:hypothetical protein